jgi:hypothetical protein
MPTARTPDDAPSRARPIAVLTAGLPQATAPGVERAIRQQGDMVLVDRVAGGMDLLVAAGQGVDIVILGAQQVYPPPGICSHLLNEYPQLKIIVITDDGLGELYRLDIRHDAVEVTPIERLLDNIRRAYTQVPAI